MSRYSKMWAAVAVAALNALVAALTDGTVTEGEWRGIGATLLAAVAVYLAPPNDYSEPTTDDF